MTVPSAAPADGRNADLQTLHTQLIDLVARLERSIDDAPSAEAIVAITEQMAEVNARVTSTGGVLLARQSTEITRLTEAVASALPLIETEIADLRRYERLVRSITGVMATVDEAVRVAGRLCP